MKHSFGKSLAVLLTSLVGLHFITSVCHAVPWKLNYKDGEQIPLKQVTFKSEGTRPVLGTFWSMQRTHFPPLPCFSPLLFEAGVEIPVYALDAERGVYLLDDRAVDYDARYRERQKKKQEETLLRSLELNLGLMSMEEFSLLEGDGGTMEAYSYAAGTLWLEIVTVTNAHANLIIHGTTSGQEYALLSKLFLTNTAWVFEQVVVGSQGQDWTSAFAPVAERTNELFFWAVSLNDTDGDGLPDFWELEQGLNPNNATDGNADPDGDGYTNLDEFLLGQDPQVSDPPRPTITIAATDASAGEPNNTGTITLTRTGVTTRALTAYYTVYGSARGGYDYLALSGQVVFSVGQNTSTVTIQPVDDQNYEGAEDLTLQILPSAHYLNATNALATVTIADNETQPIRVWSSPEEITEGGSNAVFAFMREGDLRSPLTINFVLSGTATNGAAYQTLPLSITFATNEFLTNLTLVPINNTSYSGTRVAQLSIQTNSAYVALTNVTSATITIFDDEAPTVQVLADDSDAREGSPVRDGRFKFIRNATINEPLEVTFAIHGTANPGYDYDILPTTITIPANTNAAYLTVHPVDDGVYEMCEPVIVVLRGSRSYKIGVSTSATVLIDDNEPATFSWEITKATAIGKSGNNYLSPAEFVVRRTGSTLTDVKYQLGLGQPGGGTVTTGIEYVWSGNVEEYIPVGQPVGSEQVRVVFNGRRSEARIQWNREFGLGTPAMSPGLVAIYVPSLFGTNYKTFYLEGEAALISVAFLTNQVTEGGSATLRFTRPYPGNGTPVFGAITIPFKLEGIAALGSDYSLVPATNISVTFGQAVYTVDLPLLTINDGVSEGWESLYVKLDPMSTLYSPDNRAGQKWMAAINIRDGGVAGQLTPLDSDGDGMPDTHEQTYGTDPFVFTDSYRDTDGDGIPDLEESLTGMNPTLKDTDNDALDDYIEWTFGSNPTNPAQNTLQPLSNYAPVKLSVSSCFKCHQTTLNVGQFQLTSVPPIKGHTEDDTQQEQIFQFLKGGSYPITIGGPATSESAASYTAQILPPTNGVPPEFFIQDPDVMLGVSRPMNTLPGKVATLIVPKVELTWTNKGDNLALDDHPQTNAAYVQLLGKRIFVGAKTPTDTNPRNTVMLKIKTTPPLAGSNVWLRALDVDDTTDDKQLDNTGIIDSNGRAGGDNFVYQLLPQYGYGGQFVTSSSPDHSVVLDSNGQASVEMRVSMQPGDNYRVAATVFPTSQLSGMSGHTPTAFGYVSAYTDVVRGGFNGALSPVLTVWRKLHFEFDSMAAMPTNGSQANFETGVVRLSQANIPAPGYTRITTLSRLRQYKNAYQSGRLVIAGYPAFTVFANEFNLDYNGIPFHYIYIQGSPGTNIIGQTFKLTDDDATPFGDEQPRTMPYALSGGALINTTFADAFIKPEAVPINYIDIDVPFKMNLDAVFGYYTDWLPTVNHGRDLIETPIYWYSYLLAAFQGGVGDDGDPDSENFTLGQTDPGIVPKNRSSIFIEPIRELEFSGEYPRIVEELTVVHEIGHQGGGTHEDGGIMSPDLPINKRRFKPITINRFRKSETF